MTDVVYPALIVLTCILVAAVVHRLTRPAPSRDDLTLPNRVVRAGSPDHRLALTNWHLEYGDALLDFIERSDCSAGHDGAGNAKTSPERLDEILDQATDQHPFVEMRAELGAMRAAAEALTAAATRGDTPTAARHQQIYLAYRDAWLERVWQFPGDPERIAELRRRSIPPLQVADGGPASDGTGDSPSDSPGGSPSG